MGCIIWWDPDIYLARRPVPHMNALRELLEQIRAAGRTAEHDFRDNTWVLVVDGEVVARGHSQGEMIDAGRRWWGSLGYRDGTAG